jgi:O-antigen ligase
MPRIAVGFFGWNARPEHFAAAIVAPCVGIWLLSGKRGSQLDKLDYWVLAYVLINYVSSAFGSPEPSATLRWALQNNLAVLSYFLIRLLVRDLKTLQNAFRILLGVGIVEAAYGILCYASNHAFGTTGGMEIAAYLSNVAAPYGSMYEPNLFGAYCAACAVLFLSVYLYGDQRRIGGLIGYFLASIATVLSFSRAALFALVVVVCFVLWKAPVSRTGYRSKVAVFALALGLALVITTTAIGGVLHERLSDLLSQGLREGNTIGRFIVIQSALQEVPTHLLLGSGTASFNLSFDWAEYIPEWASDKSWIGNTPVRILHDTGLVGLMVFVGFLVSLWRRVRRCFRHSIPKSPVLLGLSAGAILYAISFQLTDGTILAFSWVHLGFLASAAVLLSPSNQSANSADSAVRKVVENSV